MKEVERERHCIIGEREREREREGGREGGRERAPRNDTQPREVYFAGS